VSLWPFHAPESACRRFPPFHREPPLAASAVCPTVSHILDNLITCNRRFLVFVYPRETCRGSGSWQKFILIVCQNRRPRFARCNHSRSRSRHSWRGTPNRLCIRESDRLFLLVRSRKRISLQSRAWQPGKARCRVRETTALCQARLSGDTRSGSDRSAGLALIEGARLEFPNLN
jgi:hypothetical protein